jgi:hypothetical protein
MDAVVLRAGAGEPLGRRLDKGRLKAGLTVLAAAEMPETSYLFPGMVAHLQRP